MVKQRTLIYWYAEYLRDHDCYSAVGTTRRAVQEEVNKDPESYGPIEKRYIYYTSLFDLFEQVTGEGAGRGWGFKEPQK